MLVYFDLDLRQLIQSPQIREEIESLVFARGDTPDLEVKFVRLGTVIEQALDSMFFCVKRTNEFDGDPLILTQAFTKTGTGEDTVFTGQPAVNSNEINTAIASATDGILTLEGEIGFISDGRNTTSRRFVVTIERDYFQGDESTPAADAVSPYPATPTPKTLLGGASDSETWVQRSAAEVLDFLGIKFGSVSLLTGATNATIAFPTAYASAPRKVECQIALPYGGGMLAAAVSQPTVTATGFVAVLAAAVPEAPTPPDGYSATGYVLHWTAIL